MGIHERLKAIRIALGDSQEAFARKLGITQSSYSALEVGKYEMRLSTFIALLNKTGANPYYVLNNEGEMFGKVIKASKECPELEEDNKKLRAQINTLLDMIQELRQQLENR